MKLMYSNFKFALNMKLVQELSKWFHIHVIIKKKTRITKLQLFRLEKPWGWGGGSVYWDGFLPPHNLNLLTRGEVHRDS